MRKNGIIPPHFAFYLENDGIEISDYKPGNLTCKDPNDRIVVKFPYSIKNLNIQVIFDKLDYSTPPDFILINEEAIMMRYKEIIKDWNFRESSTLYKSLNKIKELYSKEQEKKLNEIILISNENYIDINNINDPNELESSNVNIFELIEKLKNFLKNRFNSYKNVNKSDCNLEIIINYLQFSCNYSDITSSTYFQEIPKNHVIISYPVDFLLKGRNLNRYPIINIYIPISYEMNFNVDVITPYYINNSDFKFNRENIKLKNYYEYLVKFESLLIEYFKEMQLRENVINKILDANIGFPLEIDTYGFYKLSLFFHFNKNNMGLGNSSLRMKGNVNMSNIMLITIHYNMILSFNFCKDDYHKIELIIVDSDKVGILIKKKFEYSANERELNNLIQQILQSVLDILNPNSNSKKILSK